MKIERLYALMLHLMNHGKTSSTELASKFEVSVRTIQRDIDSLCMAGIPIIAETGKNGGYYLADWFLMNNQIVTEDDFSYILTALKGYSTAIENTKLDLTIEKVASLTKKHNENIVLDFSVLREIDKKMFYKIQEAIRLKKIIRIFYTNAKNISRTHLIEPIAILYKWYAWYLLAYSIENNDYRLYKIVRITQLDTTDLKFTKEHDDTDCILKELDRTNNQEVTQIKIICKPAVKSKVIEYLNGKVTAEYQNGDCEMTLSVIETEHVWLGTILSLGNEIYVKEPEYIRKRIIQIAENILSIYE
ncbi:YafY family protein [Erysipelotrichaceae bacterium HCN-30851]